MGSTPPRFSFGTTLMRKEEQERSGVFAGEEGKRGGSLLFFTAADNPRLLLIKIIDHTLYHASAFGPNYIAFPSPGRLPSVAGRWELLCILRSDLPQKPEGISANRARNYKKTL